MADGDQILLYDTLTGSKQPFRPLEAGKCGIYCCGPTVYDMSHIGHARAAIAPDVLVRFLRHRGFEVNYVRNITDVDDKIIRRANENGSDPTAVSERYTEEYLRDLDDLKDGDSLIIDLGKIEETTLYRGAELRQSVAKREPDLRVPLTHREEDRSIYPLDANSDGRDDLLVIADNDKSWLVEILVWRGEASR